MKGAEAPAGAPVDAACVAGERNGDWVDSHCHVYDERMPGGPAGAIADARDAGVTTLIAVGCDRETSLAAAAIAAASHDGVTVRSTVGLHPHEARHGVDTIADLFDDLAPIAAPIAVGECGLDYHYDHSPRDAQRTAFAEQIAIANRRRLPLVIHTREAWSDTFAVLDSEGVPERTIFHCFTGGPGEADECLARGAFVSFSGIVTFGNAGDVRAAVARCPLDRTLVETDSPYLAPAPHRGKPNRPAWVPLVGACIAEVHDVPLDRVRLSTRAAARRAFGLGHS